MRRGIFAALFPMIAQDWVHGRRKAPGFRHIADDAAVAVGDEGASHGRVRPSVFLVEVLNDLLARLGVEVHINIGRHLPLFRQEALEYQPVLDRVDRRDLEQISHH